MDSTVLLWELLAQGREVLAVGVNYGQKHFRELEAAKQICQSRGVRYQVADLRTLSVFFSGSALTSSGIEVPAGHYTDVSMKQTVVPNRNMILVSIAAAWALSEKADTVAYAAHSGDHTIYPDCRPEFVEALSNSLLLADWNPLRLEAPFVNMTKAEICHRGAELGVPFALTWSCYRGGERHCGTCGTCVERREAFQLSGIEDPTDYA